MKAADYKELLRLRGENRRMRQALFRIMDMYAKAPGWAAPTPTPKLVNSMYQVALKAASKCEPG